MKKHFLIILIMHAVLQVFSRGVDEQLARMVGLNFYQSHFKAANKYLPENVSIRDITHFKVSGSTVYYIINFNPAGFIIVAAESSVRPVLGYSFSGNCSVSEAPPAFIAWMKQFEEQILFCKSHPEYAETFDPGWKKWDQADAGHQDVIPGVSPLLTCNWNQNAPYNDHCPADPSGPGGHAYAGCVPVAMGQLMYYFRWPVAGAGTYSYYDSTYGTIAADFGTTTYLWNNMPNSIATGNEGIGTLLFHLGVSCDLVYGPEGSGMYNHKAAYALRTHFRYSPQTQYLYRDSTTLDWDSVIIAHLNRKMPMYYAGWSKPWTDGHAFVCDGYQDTAYFHFNFGWGGQNNGYYYTDNLTPGGNNFKLAQELIINAYPDTLNNTYPVYCNGPVTLNYLTGSFEDGSGPDKNYLSGNQCEWFIDPQPENDSISEINLNFHRFNTDASDTLYIFNGFQPQAGILASFSGDTLPGSVKITGNRIKLAFRTHSASGAPGFMGTYTTKAPVWCTGTQTIIADTAVITDGSGDFDYHNNSVCRWILRSASGGPLTVYFRKFETEAGKDVLRFYDMTSSDTLAALSGVYLTGNPPDSVTAPGGKMLVIFMTNNNTTASGWEIYWPKTHTGISVKPLLFNFSISPNPVSDQATIRFMTSYPQKCTISVMDLTGQILLDQTNNFGSGNQESQLFTNNFLRGVYMVKLVTAEGSSVKKMVIR